MLNKHYRILLITISCYFVLFCFSCKTEKGKDARSNEQFLKSPTFSNVKDIIQKESKISKDYLHFAKIAESEGKVKVSKLFISLARSASANAGVYYRFAPENLKNEIRQQENPRSSSTGENIAITMVFINKTFLPDISGYIHVADNDSLINMHGVFSWSEEIFKKHSAFLKTASEALKTGEESGFAERYFICPKCGNIYSGKNVPPYCDLCMTYKGNFVTIM